MKKKLACLFGLLVILADGNSQISRGEFEHLLTNLERDAMSYPGTIWQLDRKTGKSLPKLSETHPLSGGKARVKYQYRIELEQADTKAGTSRLSHLYVWLPPASKTIRGLLLATGEIALSESIRRTCSDNDLGIVSFRGLLGTFRYWEEGDRDAQKLLKAFDMIAERTGHKEVRRVPWITFGHSTGGITCRNIAYWKPDRVAGVIHYKSGNFHAKNTLPAEDVTLAGVPMMVINGQYETFGPDGIEQPDEGDKRLDKRYGRETQWIYVREDIRKFRERDHNHLMSLILDLGGDHFFGSPELWEQAALFIQKTAQRRIPIVLPEGDDPIRCMPVAVESGWLSDADLKQPKHKPAAWADYSGDKVKAFWHYDKEMAEAAERHHLNINNPQCLSVPEFTFLDKDDGWSFRAKSKWLDQFPDSYCGPLAGMKVGHSGQPFEYRCQTEFDAPVMKIDFDIFRVLRPQDYQKPGSGYGKLHIVAVHNGDAKFRATNRWGSLDLPAVKGEKQTIEFAPIKDFKSDNPGGELKALASSGLPVYFEVDYGPVVIEEGKLVVRDLPVNPLYPLECRVTAWQIGRRIGNPVEAAPPVSQTFRIIR